MITEEVTVLRRSLGIPGMRVLQFAFGGGEANPHLPAAYGCRYGVLHRHPRQRHHAGLVAADRRHPAAARPRLFRQRRSVDAGSTDRSGLVQYRTAGGARTQRDNTRYLAMTAEQQPLSPDGDNTHLYAPRLVISIARSLAEATTVTPTAFPTPTRAASMASTACCSRPGRPAGRRGRRFQRLEQPRSRDAPTSRHLGGFLPGIAEGARYKFEILGTDGTTALKADPYARDGTAAADRLGSLHPLAAPLGRRRLDGGAVRPRLGAPALLGLRTARRFLAAPRRRTLVIAEESTAWPQVTRSTSTAAWVSR